MNAADRARAAILEARIADLERNPAPEPRRPSDDVDPWRVKAEIFKAGAAQLRRELDEPTAAPRTSGFVSDISPAEGRAELRARQLAHPESQAILARRRS